MSALFVNLQALLNLQLRLEIENFRNSGRGSALNEHTFNPLDPRNCFLGQAVPNKEEYRRQVGTLISGWKHIPPMTPLEIWSAHYWSMGEGRDMVLQVLRYIKKEADHMGSPMYPAREVERLMKGG